MKLKRNGTDEIFELFANSEHYPQIPYRYLGLNEYSPSTTYQKLDEYYLLCNADYDEQYQAIMRGNFRTIPHFHSCAFEGFCVLGSKDVTTSTKGVITFNKGTLIRLGVAFQYDLSEDPDNPILLDMLTSDFITGITCANRELAERNIRLKHVALLDLLTKSSIEATDQQLVPLFVQQLQTTFGIDSVGRVQEDTPKDYLVSPENRYFEDSTLANLNYYLQFIDGFEIKIQNTQF